MKSFQERLKELKEDLKVELQSRMIFLTNPKDHKTLEAVIAWTSIPKQDFSDVYVEDDASMERLWTFAAPDVMLYATALCCPLKDALQKMKQLQRLGIIYPDGSISELAVSIINIYIKNQVSKMTAELEKTNDK